MDKSRIPEGSVRGVSPVGGPRGRKTGGGKERTGRNLSASVLLVARPGQAPVRGQGCHVHLVFWWEDGLMLSTAVCLLSSLPYLLTASPAPDTPHLLWRVISHSPPAPPLCAFFLWGPPPIVDPWSAIWVTGVGSANRLLLSCAHRLFLELEDVTGSTGRTRIGVPG